MDPKEQNEAQFDGALRKMCLKDAKSRGVPHASAVQSEDQTFYIFDQAHMLEPTKDKVPDNQNDDMIVSVVVPSLFHQGFAEQFKASE